MPESGWPAPTAPGPVDAQVVVPGSKSQTNRALLLAGLADGPSTLDGVLRSRDTTLMRAGLTALGVGFQELGPGRLRILPPDRLHHAEKPVDCGLVSTVMRFLAGRRGDRSRTHPVHRRPGGLGTPGGTGPRGPVPARGAGRG